MSDDIVERLREAERGAKKNSREEVLFVEAADEIERLRALLREAREVIDGTHIEQYVEPLAARIDAALNKGGGDE